MDDSLQSPPQMGLTGLFTSIDRILLETDAPSIATETTLATEVESRHLIEVAQKVAELRWMSFAQVCLKTTENARRLFRLH